MSNEIHPGTHTLEIWEEARMEIRRGLYDLAEATTTIKGRYVMEATCMTQPLHYGWIWFAHETGNQITITNMFVPEPLRGCGIACALVDAILKEYPETRLIVTAKATESAARWLTKRGFIFNTSMDRWEMPWPRQSALEESMGEVAPQANDDRPWMQGHWEVVRDPEKEGVTEDNRMYRVRWSLPNKHGEWFWCRHYPGTGWGQNACEREAKELEDGYRKPWHLGGVSVSEWIPDAPAPVEQKAE